VCCVLCVVLCVCVCVCAHVYVYMYVRVVLAHATFNQIHGGAYQRLLSFDSATTDSLICHMVSLAIYQTWSFSWSTAMTFRARSASM